MFNPQMWLWNYQYRELPGDQGNDDLQTQTEVERSSIDGYSVEALDGPIGHVDEVLHEEEFSRIVVDTGRWIFGTKVVLPAGVIDHVDLIAETVYVNRTKDEIKAAPRLTDDDTDRDLYLQHLGSYYDEGGAGFRPSHERLRPWP